MATTPLQEVAVIRKYVEWHRLRYGVRIGMEQTHMDDGSANAQMIENLARDRFPDGFWWRDLASVASERQSLAEYSELMLAQHYSSWHLSAPVQEIVWYVHDFREAHQVELSQPRPFKIHDLDELGQYVVRGLINSTVFNGAWRPLSKAEYAERVADCVRRVLRPRLSEYRRRPAAVATSH